MSRIATFANNNDLFTNTFRLQSAYALAQGQASSGLKAPDGYEGIASDAQTLLGLQSQVNALVAKSNNIKTAQTIINVASNATGDMSDVLSRINSVFSSVLGQPDSPSAISTNLTSQATALRDQLVSLMNTQVAGRYVFGGSVQNTKPVDITDPAYNTATPSATVPDTNYYHGDNYVQTTRASESMTISFGVTADNPAFEKALRALNLVLAHPTDVDVIKQAFTLNTEAIGAMADITGALNAKNTVLSNELTYQASAIGYLEESVSGLRDADVASATVQATQIETQLQSSYGILSKVLNLRLSDYLK